MKCPHDGTILQPVRIGRIALDKCHTCDGLWCDHGELEAIRETELTEVEQKLEESYGNPEVKVAETDGFMRCPRCEGGRLSGMTYAIHRPMRVDRCDTCFGLWLDAGELDKAIGKPTQQEETDERRLSMVFRSVTQWFS